MIATKVPAQIGSSHQFTQERFSSAAVAARYPAEFRATWRDQRERRAIDRCLHDVPAAAHVLDLPCGTGRVTRHLLERGYRVTAVDASSEMVVRARSNLANFASRRVTLRFEVRDVMRSGFADGEFDAVICNRLFHHFSEPATRRAALAELRRIARAPIIVSFFNSFAFSAAQSRLAHMLRRTKPSDRIPISLETFQRDVSAAGLRVESRVSTLWGVSPQWYVVLRRA